MANVSAIQLGRANNPTGRAAARPAAGQAESPIRLPLIAPQLCTIGYFAKIVSIRLNASSTAVCGAMPFFMTLITARI